MKIYHIPNSKLSAIHLGANGSKPILVPRNDLGVAFEIAAKFPAGSPNRRKKIVSALQSAGIL